MLTLLRSFHRSLWKNVERRNVCQTHWMHSDASSLALPICPMIRLKCFGQQSEIGRKNGKVGNDKKTEWTLSSAWFGYLEVKIHKVTTLSTASLYLMIAQRNEIWDSETYQKISKIIHTRKQTWKVCHQLHRQTNSDLLLAYGFTTNMSRIPTTVPSSGWDTFAVDLRFIEKRQRIEQAR